MILGFDLGEFLSIFGEVMRVVATGPLVFILGTLEFDSQLTGGWMDGSVVVTVYFVMLEWKIPRC